MPAPCRNKRGKFVSCGKKKTGSRKSKKEKESKSRSRKAKESRSLMKKKPSSLSRRKTAMKTSKTKTPKTKTPKMKTPKMKKTKKPKTKTPPYYRKVVRYVPTAPDAPSYQTRGILRPGYYGRVSRPPPAPMSAPQMPEHLCWSNKNKESCNKRLPCAWNESTNSCGSRRKGGRAAAFHLGGPGRNVPLSVCGTAGSQSECDSVHGCRWSSKGNVCVPKKAEEYSKMPHMMF